MNTKSVILAGLLSLISACSNDPAAYSPRTVQSGTPPLPIYVFGSDLALGQTVALHASCAARSATVLCEKPSGTGTSTYQTLTTDSPNVHAVATGIDNFGAVWVMCVGADYVTNTSLIQLFKDINADGLPDQISKVTIATLANAHVTSLDVLPSAAAAFVGDPLNRKIYRLVDSTGSGVPTQLQVPSFDGGLLPPATGGPLPLPDFILGRVVALDFSTVRVIPLGFADVDPNYFALVDTDASGQADVSIPRSRSVVEPDGEFGVFVDPTYASDTSVRIAVPLGHEFRVECIDITPTETLAEGYGKLGVFAIELDRALNAAENIRIVDVTASVTHQEVSVLALGITSVLSVDVGDRHRVIEGTAVTIAGRQFTGSETVEVRVDEDGATWSTVNIDSWTATELVVTLPDFSEVNADDPATVLLRITPTTGLQIGFRLLVADQ